MQRALVGMALASIAAAGTVLSCDEPGFTPEYAAADCGADFFLFIGPGCARSVTMKCDDGVTASTSTSGQPSFSPTCQAWVGPYGAPRVDGSVDPTARCTLTANCDFGAAETVTLAWEPSDFGACASPSNTFASVCLVGRPDASVDAGDEDAVPSD